MKKTLIRCSIGAVAVHTISAYVVIALLMFSAAPEAQAKPGSFWQVVGGYFNPLTWYYVCFPNEDPWLQ